MILDTMTLEELILEIKTDFKEVRGRWNNHALADAEACAWIAREIL